jgi:hypothetical protein
MRRIALTGLVLVAALSRIDHGWSQHHPDVAEIVLAGDLLGDGPWPEDGSAWLGLYAGRGGYDLRSVRLSVGKIPNACGDSATRISAPGPGSPLFLVRGVPSVRAGRVASAFRGDLFLYPGQSRSIELGDDVWYVLQAFGSAASINQEARISGYSLWLRRGAHAQRFASLPMLDSDGPPQVLWAGDLDRDGKLDLFTDLRRHYAGHHYVLFLSSAAPPDSMIRGIARIDVSGC